MTYYQSNGNIAELSNTFIDQQELSTCLESNSTDEEIGINSTMLTLQSNYSIPSHFPQHSLKYPENQQLKNQILEIENPLDHPMINNLPNQFLKKLHCILNYEILPSYIYWNENCTSFTIHFETELMHKYLPQLFLFFGIRGVVKLLKNYGFKKTKKQKKNIITYSFQHPLFIPSQPTLIDSIILENPSIDPYGEFLDGFLNQFNYCELNDYFLKLEIITLEETNLGLKKELEVTKGNIERLNLILYFLETGQFDKVNMEELVTLTTADSYQSPEAIDPQVALIIPQRHNYIHYRLLETT